MTLLYALIMLLNSLVGVSSHHGAYHINKAQFKSFQNAASGYGYAASSYSATSPSSDGSGDGIVVVVDGNEF